MSVLAPPLPAIFFPLGGDVLVALLAQLGDFLLQLLATLGHLLDVGLALGRLHLAKTLGKLLFLDVFQLHAAGGDAVDQVRVAEAIQGRALGPRPGRGRRRAGIGGRLVLRDLALGELCPLCFRTPDKSYSTRR